MGIRTFVLVLLFIAIGTYFIPVDNKQKTNTSSDIPLVIFKEPLMYTLNDSSVTKVVQASHAVKYKNREEMYDANVILTNNISKDNFSIEELRSKQFIKKGDSLVFKNDVVYMKGDAITLNTQELLYNSKTKIVRNTKPYTGKYFDNVINGSNLYLDSNKDIMKSTNTHFEVSMNNKK